MYQIVLRAGYHLTNGCPVKTIHLTALPSPVYLVRLWQTHNRIAGGNSL
jgi:hypothetical protein